MNIENVDLDINNYDLKDILNLFRIKESFDETDVKNAKQIVLKTHPDKSSLDAKYFLFYTKAFKILYQIWEFRKKGDINKEKNRNTEYIKEDDENKEVLNQYFEKNKNLLKDKKTFNKWFNEEFERNQIKSEDQEFGYGEWLKSNENLDESFSKNMSQQQMKEAVDKKKQEMRSLIVKKDVEEFYQCPKYGTELLVEGKPDYASGLFDSLQYEDLKTAYTQTLIPVSDKDYEEKQKFHTVNELQSFRSQQDTTPLSQNQAQQYLNQRSKMQEEQSVRRAFELTRQTEEAEKKQNEFLQKMKLLL
jgi:hypothetical protein